MKDELTGTDVRRMAKGYWDSYFEWRFIPKVKNLLGAAALFAVLAAIMLAIAYPPTDAAVVETVSFYPARIAILLILGSISLACLLIGIYIHSGAKAEFLDQMVDLWEQGERTLPRTEQVKAFVDGIR
jgi:hypothetical protein